MINVLFLDKIDLSDESTRKLSQIRGVNINPVEFFPNSKNEYFKDTNIVISRYTEISNDLIKLFPNLTNVIVASVTYRWVDTIACERNYIKVSNCPTYNLYSTAQFAIESMFKLLNINSIESSEKLVKDGYWSVGGHKRFSLERKIATIIGQGGIGSKISMFCEALGMIVNKIDSKSTKEEIDEAISCSEIVFVAVPLNPSTHKLISSSRLSLMKKKSILVSISPGEVIDEKALLKILKEEKIKGACLDSFIGEPFKTPSNVVKKLAKLNNTIITPHMAWNTDGSMENLGDELIEILNSIAAGKEINTIV